MLKLTPKNEGIYIAGLEIGEISGIGQVVVITEGTHSVFERQMR